MKKEVELTLALWTYIVLVIFVFYYSVEISRSLWPGIFLIILIGITENLTLHRLLKETKK